MLSAREDITMLMLQTLTRGVCRVDLVAWVSVVVLVGMLVYRALSKPPRDPAQFPRTNDALFAHGTMVLSALSTRTEDEKFHLPGH
jgi:hypothetical protein